MEQKEQNRRYEQFYDRVLAQVSWIHERNKRRIKIGMIILVVLPFLLALIRWMTDSDKGVFLLIWILLTFLLAAYLIGVEYLDHSIRKMLNEGTDMEVEFDDLLESNGPVSKRIRKRIDARCADPADSKAEAKADIKADPAGTEATPSAENNTGEDGDEQ